MPEDLEKNGRKELVGGGRYLRDNWKNGEDSVPLKYTGARVHLIDSQP